MWKGKYAYLQIISSVYALYKKSSVIIVEGVFSLPACKLRYNTNFILRKTNIFCHAVLIDWVQIINLSVYEQI